MTPHRSILPVLVLVLACKGREDTPPTRATGPVAAPSAPTPPQPVAPTPPQPTAPPAPAVGVGTCEITASGAATGHETPSGNRVSIMTEYWHGEREREAVKQQMGAVKDVVKALQLLTVNCEGNETRVSIVPGKNATRDSIPFRPKTYRIEAGAGDLTALGHAGGKLLVGPTGTIEVTAFDGKHVALTFDLAFRTMKKEEVRLVGKIDVPCLGSSACTP